jgi:hypothetical protein
VFDGGVLVTLQFQLLTDGVCNLSWSTILGDNEITDISANVLPFSFNDGSITISASDPCANANLSIVTTTFDAACYGESTGQANITMSGGAMPYTLEIWTNLPVFGWTAYVVLQTDTLDDVLSGGGWDPLGLIGPAGTLYSGPYAPAGDYYGVITDAIVSVADVNWQPLASVITP